MSSPACCSPEKSMENSRLQAQRSNESPSGAFKRQNGLAPARWRGFAPTSSATMHRMQTMQGKTRLSRRCAKVCRAPENKKSHEESYDSSWDFGALEGTRIPGPLIKSQMLYRLSYERIFRSKTILPNNITTIDCKKQEQRRKKRKFPRKRPDLRREKFSGAQHSAEAGARRL